MSETNRHHIFYPANQWKGGRRAILRNHELSVVRMDIETHNELHRDLHKIEMAFYPRLKSIMGMLALAEHERFNDMDNNHDREDVIYRLYEWSDICDDNNDTDSAHILRRQAPYIERGFVE